MTQIRLCSCINSCLTVAVVAVARRSTHAMLRLPKFSTETFGLRKVKSMEPLAFMDDVCSPDQTRNTSPLPDSLDTFCEEMDRYRRNSANPSAAALEEARIVSKVVEDTFGCKAPKELKYMTAAIEQDGSDEMGEEHEDIKFPSGRRRSISLGSRPACRTRIEAGKAFVVDSIKMALPNTKAIVRDDQEQKELIKIMMTTGLI